MKMIIYQPNDRLLLRLFGVTAIEPCYRVADEGLVAAKIDIACTRAGGLSDAEARPLREWAAERFGVETARVNIY